MGTQTCALPARTSGHHVDPIHVDPIHVGPVHDDLPGTGRRTGDRPAGGLPSTAGWDRSADSDRALLEAWGLAGRGIGVTAVSPLTRLSASAVGSGTRGPHLRPTVPVAGVARTVAGAAATRRRQRRTARRGPSAGVLPSRPVGRLVRACAPPVARTAVLGHVMGRAARLAMTLTVTVSTVVVALTLIAAPSGGAIARITVVPGDSLWSIARANDPDRDPRDVVEDIRRLNALTEGALAVGVVLTVPVPAG